MPVISKHQEILLSDIKIGTQLDEESTVNKIYARDSDYVIYGIKGQHSPVWKWNFNDEVVEEGLHKLSLLLLSADQRFKGTPFLSRSELILATVRVIFRTRNHNAITSSLNHLSVQIHSRPAPKQVISRTRDFTVWIREDDGISYDCKNVSDMTKLLAEYDRIYALSSAMLPKSQRTVFNRRLAATLSKGFRNQTNDTDAAINLFAPLESLIHKAAESSIRTKYIVATVLAAATTILTLTILLATGLIPAPYKPLVIALSGGITGTFISLIERSNTIAASEYNSTPLTLLQGLVRVCLGGLFGAIAFLAASSGFAFTAFTQSNAQIVLLAIAAGFSERLIPDLINGITAQKN